MGLYEHNIIMLAICGQQGLGAGGGCVPSV